MEHGVGLEEHAQSIRYRTGAEVRCRHLELRRSMMAATRAPYDAE